MARISKQEVLKIAQISRIALQPDEIESVIGQLEDVLTYAERVKELASVTIQPGSMQQVNVFRPDLVISTDSKPILAQAPETIDDCFVVPKILGDNE